MNKKYVLAFALIALLLFGVGQVMADSATGQLEVTRPGPYVRDVVMPTPLDPGQTYHTTFTIECLGGYKLDNLELIRAVWHHDSVGEAGGDVIQTRYTIDYDNTNFVWTAVYDGAYFSGIILPNPDDQGAIGIFEVDLYLPMVAAVGSWWLDIYVLNVGLPPNDYEHRVITPFEVTAFMQVTLMEATFEFESGFYGDLDLVIADPASGHLTFNVIANYAWTVEVMGTNLVGPAGSIPVGRVSHNSVGVSTGSESLLSTWAELLGLGVRPACVSEAGEDVLIFLWVDIPAGQDYGTYTFTFSVQALAAV